MRSHNACVCVYIIFFSAFDRNLRRHGGLFTDPFPPFCRVIIWICARGILQNLNRYMAHHQDDAFFSRRRRRRRVCCSDFFNNSTARPLRSGSLSWESIKRALHPFLRGAFRLFHSGRCSLSRRPQSSSGPPFVSSFLPSGVPPFSLLRVG